MRSFSDSYWSPLLKRLKHGGIHVEIPFMGAGVATRK
nr:MAG TPA: hypothetical protein [Caudoviricetes sp.]